MHQVLPQRLSMAVLGAAMAMLLAGCEMPTASLNQEPAAKSPSAVAAAPASPTTTAAPFSPSASPSAGPPAGGAAAGPAGSQRPLAGDLVGVQVPSPSTGFQPPGSGLPGGGFGPTVPPAVPSGSSTSGSRVQVQLSAGVALAQTLPDGTGMTFGVKYRFSGRRDQSTRYFWVITCQKGRPLRQEVQLAKDEDELHAVARGMLPEVGPFQCHLEAQARGASQPTVISNTARMVSDNVPR